MAIGVRDVGQKKIAAKQRLEHVFVVDAFKKAGCELLDTYTRSQVPMKYRCSCGSISKINWNNFQKGKRCWNCKTVSASGKNNYQWIEDREAVKEYYDFAQKCYKSLKAALKVSNQKKSRKTIDMLGYNPKDLQLHIKSHPNWKNVIGKKWHLDHTFPLKAFADYHIIDVRLINCLDNLQPLLAE